jgi:phosphohistidine phosphatase SixA
MTPFWKCASVCVLASMAFVSRGQAQETRTIYLVRHADKVSEDVDSPLSDAGRVRAKCLAKTLQDARIQQIFTSDLQRTQQTAAPLAEKLHLKPVAIPIGKPDDLIAAIQSSKAASVLVVWHDATLPKILRALGAPEVVSIAHTEYDRFFILTMAGDGKKSKAGFAALRYCDCP